MGITSEKISDQAHPHRRENHTEIFIFSGFQTQNRVCLSNKAENHLSDGSETSGIMGGSLNILFVLTPRAGSF